MSDGNYECFIHFIHVKYVIRFDDITMVVFGGFYERRMGLDMFF